MSVFDRHGVQLWLPETDAPLDPTDVAHQALMLLLGAQSRREVLRSRHRVTAAMPVHRWNPVRDWVISEQIVHPPLVTEQDFVAATVTPALRHQGQTGGRTFTFARTTSSPAHIAARHLDDEPEAEQQDSVQPCDLANLMRQFDLMITCDAAGWAVETEPQAIPQH